MSETFDKVGGAIGFANDVIGFAGLLTDTLFPPPSEAELNNFRIYVGQITQSDINEGKEESRSVGGHAPAIAGWDVVGKFMSQETPTGIETPKIVAGEFRDYAIVGRKEIDYLSVVRNGNDAVCIHLITGQSANAGRLFAWNGDLGKACGAPWYPQSNSVTNVNPESGEGFKPACVWIDGNDDIDPGFKGFNLHLGSFGGGLADETNEFIASSWSKNKDLLCKSEPRFSMYTDIEIGMQSKIFSTPPQDIKLGTPENDDAVLNSNNWILADLPPPGLLPQRTTGKSLLPTFICTTGECAPSGGSFEMDLEVGEFQRRSTATSNRQKRATQSRQEKLDKRDQMVSALRKRQARHADRLVISKIGQHSAVELCNSVSSLGPDFVSVTEGMYCDMQEKRLWPVCSDKDSGTGYCFDVETNSIRGAGTTLDNGIAAAMKAMDGDGARNSDFNVPVKAYTDVSTWEA